MGEWVAEFGQREAEGVVRGGGSWGDFLELAVLLLECMMLCSSLVLHVFGSI